ncbi:MAG: hypothetical protein WD005_03240 [Haliea sp.]
MQNFKSFAYGTVRLFEFIPMWGIRVFFVYAPRRVKCPRWLLLKRPENLTARKSYGFRTYHAVETAHEIF